MIALVKSPLWKSRSGPNLDVIENIASKMECPSLIMRKQLFESINFICGLSAFE